MEALPNPLLKKKLYSWIKSEARKSFHQRRLHDDGNLNASASKLMFFLLHLDEKNIPPFCQQVRPTRRKHTSANAPVLQSRRSTFHAEGTGLRVLEVGYELTKPASHGPTKLNNCRVRLFWMLHIRILQLAIGDIEAVPWHVTPSEIVARYAILSVQ